MISIENNYRVKNASENSDILVSKCVKPTKKPKAFSDTFRLIVPLKCCKRSPDQQTNQAK